VAGHFFGRAVISYIVASHHWPTLRDNLAATVQGSGDDEIVLVENSTSIAAAYNEGQHRATNPIRCYIHHDVRILDAPRLREELVAACQPDVGMVGVIGSQSPDVPWWEGTCCGSVVDARMGLLDFGSGGECAYLDGLLLATAQTIEWDETYPGWHLYDHDICQQMLDRGLPNVCLNNGAALVYHNTSGPTSIGHLTGWDENVTRFKVKWGDLG
jgi:hypothetical protein